MSPLLDRQRRGVILGSIRIGTTVLSKGRMRPARLDTFRLTSPDQEKVNAAATLYGGEVKPWRPQERGAQQWEVVTTVDRLPVRVPPGEPVVQHYEQWSGTPVVRQRLCDGFLDRMSGTTCLCPPNLMERRRLAADGHACKPVTRLSLILADLPGLGVWQLTSTGDYAADELATVAEMLRRSEAVGVMLPATLRLEQRESRGSGEVHKFAVPVLDVAASLAALESGDFTPAGALTARGEPRRELEGGTEQPAPTPPVAPTPPSEPPVAETYPETGQGVADEALKSTDVDRVRRLGGWARDHKWIGPDAPEEVWVADSNGILEPLESLLRHRLDDLGANV